MYKIHVGDWYLLIGVGAWVLFACGKTIYHVAKRESPEDWAFPVIVGLPAIVLWPIALLIGGSYLLGKQLAKRAERVEKVKAELKRAL